MYLFFRPLYRSVFFPTQGNTGGGGARRSLWGELDDQAIDSNAANLPVRARDGGLASPAKASQGAGGRDTKAGETDAAMAPVSVVKLLLELNVSLCACVCAYDGKSRRPR